LDNKAPLHNCIVCLNPKVITVIGGIVQSLHEEWQMNQKYSGFSRSSLRLSQETDNGGPPPFEKLQIGAPSRRSSRQAIRSGLSSRCYMQLAFDCNKIVLVFLVRYSVMFSCIMILFWCCQGLKTTGLGHWIAVRV
jgi:hypothetical protein